MQKNEVQIPKKRKNKKVIVILIMIFIAVIAFLAYNSFQPKSRYELDVEALEGFLPGRSDDEIIAELNRVVDASMFNVSLNPTPVVSGGEINIRLENIPNNHYWMQATAYYTDAKGNERMFYESGVLKQGFYIENADVQHVPAEGQYNGRVVFKALYPETMEEIGETEALISVFVEE